MFWNLMFLQRCKRGKKATNSHEAFWNHTFLQRCKGVTNKQDIADVVWNLCFCKKEFFILTEENRKASETSHY